MKKHLNGLKYGLKISTEMPHETMIYDRQNNPLTHNKEQRGDTSQEMSENIDIISYSTFKRRHHPIIYECRDGVKGWIRETIAQTLIHYGCIYALRNMPTLSLRMKSRKRWRKGLSLKFMVRNGRKINNSCISHLAIIIMILKTIYLFSIKKN